MLFSCSIVVVVTCSFYLLFSATCGRKYTNKISLFSFPAGGVLQSMHIAQSTGMRMRNEVTGRQLVGIWLAECFQSGNLRFVNHPLFCRLECERGINILCNTALTVWQCSLDVRHLSIGGIMLNSKSKWISFTTNLAMFTRSELLKLANCNFGFAKQTGLTNHIHFYEQILPIYIGGILPIPYNSNIVISADIYRCADTSVEL